MPIRTVGLFAFCTTLGLGSAASVGCHRSSYEMLPPALAELSPSVDVTMMAPGVAAPGDTVELRFVLRNRSGRPVTLGFMADVAYSIDPIVYREDGSVLWERAVRKMTLMQGSTQVGLDAKASHEIPFKWIVPASFPPGRYELVGRLVGDNGAFMWSSKREPLTIRPVH